jgi:hypothetical protein
VRTTSRRPANMRLYAKSSPDELLPRPEGDPVRLPAAALAGYQISEARLARSGQKFGAQGRF